jgi:hypothetical protein
VSVTKHSVNSQSELHPFIHHETLLSGYHHESAEDHRLLSLGREQQCHFIKSVYVMPRPLLHQRRIHVFVLAAKIHQGEQAGGSGQL